MPEDEIRRNPTFESEEQFKAALPDIMGLVWWFALRVQTWPPLTLEDREDLAGDTNLKLCRSWKNVPCDVGRSSYISKTFFRFLWEWREKRLPIVLVELEHGVIPADILGEKYGRRLERIRKNAWFKERNFYKGRATWTMISILRKDRRALQCFTEFSSVSCESDLVNDQEEHCMSPLERAATYVAYLELDKCVDMATVERELRAKHQLGIKISQAIYGEGMKVEDVAEKYGIGTNQVRYARDKYFHEIRTAYPEMKDYLE